MILIDKTCKHRKPCYSQSLFYKFFQNEKCGQGIKCSFNLRVGLEKYIISAALDRYYQTSKLNQLQRKAQTLFFTEVK